MVEESKEKQDYLKKEILDGGYNVEEFINCLKEKKVNLLTYIF